MKKFNVLFMAMCAILLLGACSQEEEMSQVVSKTVSFLPSMTSGTRATETAFENGDEIGVFAVDAKNGVELKNTNYANNVRYRYNAGVFNAVDNGITLTEAHTAGLAYYAIYPYRTSDAIVYTHSIGYDQQSHANYTASDICFAYAAPSTSEQVNLTFNHILSNLVVEIEGNNLASKTVSMRATNVRRSVQIDLNAGTAKAVSDVGDVLMNKAYNNAFQCVIPPQTITEGTDVFVATVDGKDYPFHITSDVAFQSGRQYTYKVKIDGDKLIVISGNINPWNSDNPDTPDTPDNPNPPFQGEKMESDAALEVTLTAAERVGRVLIMDYTIKNLLDQDLNNLKIETGNGRDGLGATYSNHYLSIGEGNYDYWSQTITKLRKGASVVCHIKVKDFDSTNKTKEFTTTQTVSAENYTFTKKAIGFYTDQIQDNRVLSGGIMTPDRQLKFTVTSCKADANGFVVLDYTIENLTSDIISNFKVARTGSSKDDQNNELNGYVSLNGSDYDYWSTTADIPAKGSIKGSIQFKTINGAGVSSTAQSVTCSLECSSSNYVIEDDYIRFISVPISK